MKRNMKKLLVIALALMPSLSINTFAQDGGEGGGTIPPGSDEPIPIKPMPEPIPNPAPRSSSYDLPYCYHLSGVVYIDADTNVTYINAKVTRSADAQVWSDAAATNTLVISASPDPGEYHLQLTLSTGQSYQGKYIIE